MGIEVKVIQHNVNGYSQLEASSKSIGSIYYSVPEANEKIFSEALRLHAKNSNLDASIALGCSAIIGVLGASAITRNMNKAIDLIAKIALGSALAGISGYFINIYNNKKYDKLLQKYNAKEI